MATHLQWREAVLAAMLKLVTDQFIEVNGMRLQIRTAFSEDYHPENYPWLADGQPKAPTQDGSTGEFDIVSPLPNETPIDYRYTIDLIET